MAMRSILLFSTILGVSSAVWAQSPTYGLGRTPTAQEIHAWDIAISPDGNELPPGRGTAVEGAKLYVSKACAACHGASGSGGRAPTLIEAKGAPVKSSMPPGMEMGIQPPGLMATHAPFPNVMWDYINRAMPLNKEGTLTPDEVYSLTAFILYKNGVIKEDDVLDQNTLPKLKMPNLSGYTPPPAWKHATPRLDHYPQ
jgi:cytochrome c